jgi:hypothetical protein
MYGKPPFAIFILATIWNAKVVSFPRTMILFESPR